MKKEVNYATKSECLKAIETVKTLGYEPTPWMLEQLEEFERIEKEKASIKNSKTPIWDTLKANYPYGIMPKEKIECVENTVSQLLEDGEHAEEPGLLLGKIQCGKTDTFEDIIGLAFDKGIDIAVVITKGTKALVNQTIKRMKKDFRHFLPSDSLDQRTTINTYDIMDVWKNLKQATVEGCKTVIVSKKNSVNLSHLITLFNSKNFLKEKKVLVVDDEADFASRNYRSVKQQALTDESGNPIAQQKETEMAKIAQQIDDFRKIPDYCRYLQVTATPYCLYLQPQGELNLNGNIVKPFKPRFTSLVPVHDRYIGGQQYFVESQDPESMYSHLYHQISQKCIDILGHEDKHYINTAISSGNLYGLTYALVSYFMATAIRRIQVAAAENKDYKTSAIIHVEIDKKNHEWQYRVVNKLVNSIKSAIVEEDQSDQRIWTAIDSIYDDFIESNRKGCNAGLISVNLPSKEQIYDEIRKIFRKNNYHIQMVNSDEQMNTLLDEETGELTLDTAATIFIGGNILDRGVTIRNMLCFFYGRNPKNFQQDTVLQHARMYGARSKEDMAVMRFHTTPHIYKILGRMNELDEQLRQWFIEGNDKKSPDAIFVGYDKNIKPCASKKIKVSNAIALKKHQCILPIGFWTGTNSAIKKTIEKIDLLIAESRKNQNKDSNDFLLMEKESVIEILKLIESTFVYEDRFCNKDRKNDIKELLCALEYCTTKSNGKVYVLPRNGRELKRIRENGGFIDAPFDGRTDLAPSKSIAKDIPVVMLLGQKGAKNIDSQTGENIGWNNAPFYWPVLLTQENINPVVFAIDQKKADMHTIVDISHILEGIDPKEVLSLTIKGDLEAHFGKEGADYSYQPEDHRPAECRILKNTTASRYLVKDENGKWAKDPKVPYDEKNDHGLYSYNMGQFPFILKPYKYMLLRNGRNAYADVMLMELTDPSEWNIEPNTDLNKDGDLVDSETNEILFHGSDTIIDKRMNTREFVDKTICIWEINYAIKKVLKCIKHSADLDSIFEDDNYFMTKEEALEYCRYYDGGNKPKTKLQKEGFYNYEEVWFKMVTSERQDPCLDNYINEYKAKGLEDYGKNDGVPMSLKALIFNRYMHNCPYASKDELIEWYEHNYLKTKGLFMTREEALKCCRYYDGGIKPKSSKKNTAWYYYEKDWVDLVSRKDRCLDFDKIMDFYKEYELEDYGKDDGVPMSIKALLWYNVKKKNSNETTESFIKWYEKNYLKKP